MSVHTFGHFEQFFTFSARRAPCSAPSCTLDAWTNGPYMTWLLSFDELRLAMNAHLPVVRPLLCYARRGATPMHQK